MLLLEDSVIPLEQFDYILAAEPAWIIVSSLHTGLSLSVYVLRIVAVYLN